MIALFLLSSVEAFSEEISKDQGVKEQSVDESIVQEEEFSACLIGLQDEARSRGVSTELVNVLGQVKRIERSIKLDRNQPEFVQTFADYFTRRVTDYRVTQGRELLKEHRQFLDSLTKKYGVPPQYIVAFWGLESNFGSYIGKMPVLDSLATLACDKRRSELFTRELFSALDIMAKHRIPVEQMQGSWAGAIGHTQFLPSAYSQYGVDGDGDGRVDLWSSQIDALTSAANYLNKLGWEKELRWGREVTLPVDFDYSLSGIKNPKTLSEWRKLHVKKTSGQELPDVNIDAALLVPSGSDGPIFLVYDNFEVIMRWNRSQFYALSVGSLADRINGAGDFYQPFPEGEPLTKDQVIALQTRLEQMGFEPGKIDGRLGPATTESISRYQKSINKIADGFADFELLKSLNIL